MSSLALTAAVSVVAILMGLNLLEMLPLRLPSLDVDVRALGTPPLLQVRMHFGAVSPVCEMISSQCGRSDLCQGGSVGPGLLRRCPHWIMSTHSPVKLVPSIASHVVCGLSCLLAPCHAGILGRPDICAGGVALQHTSACHAAGVRLHC